MAFGRHDARWREAAMLTVSLWLFVLIIYSPVMIDQYPEGGWLSVALEGSTVLVSMMLGMSIFSIFRTTLRWSRRRRALALAGAVIGAVILQTNFDFLFTGWVANNLEVAWAGLPRSPSQSYVAAFNSFCIFSVNLVLIQLMYARRRDVSRERQLADARWSAQQAQLAALRYQLNPHFLFNTLNAISAMIVTGRNAEAEQMTDKLSNFLRASLGSDPTELVPLDAELTLVEEYLEIESIRFGDRLAIDISSTGEAGSVSVPSFLLQPLVENAVKYGVAPSPEPVMIRVSAAIEGEHLVITVEDDGAYAPDAAKTSGAGVGLQNVRWRLETLYRGAASLEAGPRERGYMAKVRLPIADVPARPNRLERAASSVRIEG